MKSGQCLWCRGEIEHLGSNRGISHQRWFHIEKGNTSDLKDLTWWAIDTMERVFLIKECDTF